MSSWDRARFIPWSRIPQDGADLDGQKERLFRELQRETQQTELSLQERNPAIPSTTTTTDDATTNAAKSTKVPYSHMELLRQAAFGACIGSITGCVFGFMDGMRTAGQSDVLQKASNMAKFRYLMQGTTRSGSVFGAFFGGFHVVKYGLRTTLDPGEAGEIVISGAVSMGALMSKPAFRPFMPYGSMLIIMDIAHIVMREMDKE
ncbi:expressed unknown protein [Seminavis robusta]|uniref:Mitochondrial import inner membrane translocase subunit TIM22 n=1 Tax=Seminavis robusta TaxID=568900 RepID=A0A9N8DLY0_9STRA|nr:expressed unknown protein [Seminavis robusta]|eukprot:Sro232_g094050.1 n/a (204) ;mRNA; r:78678-79409